MSTAGAITSEEEEAAGDAVVVRGARLPLHDAQAEALAGRAAAAAEAADTAKGATDALVHDAGAAVTHVQSGVGGAFSSGGARLRVSFHDVDAMAAEIAALSRDATEFAAGAARVAIDGDLIVSLPLSPVTGVRAEAAVGLAATGLAQSALRAAALAISVGAVASTYAAADAWLAAAAGSLRASTAGAVSLTGAGAAFAGSLTGAAAAVAGAQVAGDVRVAVATAGTLTELAVATVAAPVLAAGAVAAVAGAFGAETLRALGGAFDAANAAFGGADGAFNPFDTADLIGYGTALALGFDRAFNLDRAVAGSAGGIQAILGATGPFYDDILAGLVTAGVAAGFFRDGEVTVRPAGDVDATLLARSTDNSAKALGSDPAEFRVIDGRIVPDGWASTMAGLGQLDELGETARAIIRVFTVLDADGAVMSYRVQIPSTASWDPSTESHGSPGDLTSDVYSLWRGSDASLAGSVYEAMRQAGIPTGAGAPAVELDGFSLGGITAAVVAADPRGFNITEIHTAGAPIGGIHVGSGVRVFALEADQDLVAALDGRSNPQREGWLTVGGPAVRTMDEPAASPMLPGAVHKVRRYAVMGADTELRDVGALLVPEGGSVLVNDFQSERVR